MVGRLVQGVCSAPVWPPLAWDGEASQVHAAYAAAVADCVWDVVTAPLVLLTDSGTGLDLRNTLVVGTLPEHLRVDVTTAD